MHTHFEGILYTHDIEIEGDYYCKVFIWSSKEMMQRAFKKIYSKTDFHALRNAEGCCHTFPMAINNDGSGEMSCGKKFAEIHLILDNIGAGYVAHELMHLINYYVYYKNIDLEDVAGDEKAAHLMEVITKDFWRFYYSTIVHNEGE